MFTGRKSRLWLLVVLLLVGTVWLWEDVVKDRVIPKRFGVVQEGQIYRSGQLSSSLVERTLVKYKIARIVCLSGDSSDDIDKNAERQVAAKLGIERLIFPLRGNGTGDITHYAKAIAAICEAQKKHKPVLVHCSAGAQRTGGVIAAYRLLVEKKDASFVLAEMMRYDWNPKSNPHLLPYLNSHMAELAMLLHQMGVIDYIPSPLPQLEVKNHRKVKPSGIDASWPIGPALHQRLSVPIKVA
jgi:protein tyrosine phosphatase (PTP) superfamily phosphohydrolase (DUF442 family)